MLKNNEFKGASLRDAVKQATAAYDRRSCEVKNQRRCNDFILETSSLQREIGRLSDEANRLEDEADRMRESAMVDLGLSALAGLGALARALRGLSVVARRLRNKDSKRLTEREIVDLLHLPGPVGAAAGAVYAATQLREAQRLARRAEEIERNGGRKSQRRLPGGAEKLRWVLGKSSQKLTPSPSFFRKITYLIEFTGAPLRAL